MESLVVPTQREIDSFMDLTRREVNTFFKGFTISTKDNCHGFIKFGKHHIPVINKNDTRKTVSLSPEVPMFIGRESNHLQNYFVPQFENEWTKPGNTARKFRELGQQFHKVIRSRLL